MFQNEGNVNMTENFKNDSEKNEGVLELINSSTEIVGGTVVGLATGLLTGDPALATVLGVGGKAIEIGFRLIGNEIYERMIGPREKARAGAAISLAAAGIRKRLENGESFRKDGFFEETPTNRSNLEEVDESTLKKVMDTTEEPKIKFMANLAVNIRFDQDLDMDTYRQILKDLDELTYRQLCIIRLVILRENSEVDMIAIEVEAENEDEKSLEQMSQDEQMKFHSISMDFHEMMVDDSYLQGVRVSWTNDGDKPFLPSPSQTRSTYQSRRLYSFANLDEIPIEDIEKTFSLWNVKRKK